MKAVWPDSFVEESNLTQTIFMVRKTLDETSDRPYILTVQGKGYRFVVPVTETSNNGRKIEVPLPARVPGSSPEIQSTLHKRPASDLAVRPPAVSRTLGTTPLSMRSWSTVPGPTDGSWSTSRQESARRDSEQPSPANASAAHPPWRSRPRQGDHRQAGWIRSVTLPGAVSVPRRHECDCYRPRVSDRHAEQYKHPSGYQVKADLRRSKQ